MSVNLQKCLFGQNLLGKITKISSICLKKFSNHEYQTRKLPKCVYVLPPTQWLMNKINIQRLKFHDRDFCVDKFNIGAKQAAFVMMEIARSRDSAYLARISTLRGFSRIYRDMIASQNDPRRKLLFFDSQDIQKVVITDVAIIETEIKFYCIIEVFFVCMKYLDEIIKLYEKVDPNVSLQIYQDIKNAERMSKNTNYSAKSQIPLSEKLLVTEGYLHLYSSYPQGEKDDGWRIDLFKISEFNIVNFKGS